MTTWIKKKERENPRAKEIAGLSALLEYSLYLRRIYSPLLSFAPHKKFHISHDLRERERASIIIDSICMVSQEGKKMGNKIECHRRNCAQRNR
jgi:hypothetical protein